MGRRGSKKRGNDGGEMLMHSFNEMCERLDFIAEVLRENGDHMKQKHKDFVVGNAFAIEQEWILNPMYRHPENRGKGRGGDDNYTEYYRDS